MTLDVSGMRRPALIDLSDAQEGRVVPDSGALDRLWAETPDVDRIAFHAFCCGDDRSDENAAAMQRIAARVRAVVG